MFVGELLWELLGFYAVKREHATSFKVSCAFLWQFSAIPLSLLLRR